MHKNEIRRTEFSVEVSMHFHSVQANGIVDKGERKIKNQIRSTNFVFVLLILHKESIKWNLSSREKWEKGKIGISQTEATCSIGL
jgi:hypothetical protein